jgi:hypothetical protein
LASIAGDFLASPEPPGGREAASPTIARRKKQ